MDFFWSAPRDPPPLPEPTPSSFLTELSQIVHVAGFTLVMGSIFFVFYLITTYVQNRLGAKPLTSQNIHDVVLQTKHDTIKSLQQIEKDTRRSVTPVDDPKERARSSSPASEISSATSMTSTSE